MAYDLGAIKEISYPIERDSDLDVLINQIGNCRAVLIGEATHGTHEFYEWRARLSKRLIEEKNFNFVAVEGDWPDCYELNKYSKGMQNVKKYPNAFSIMKHLTRWPTWMWSNEEVLEFIEWLRRFNDNLIGDERIGFYGLDVYSLWQSLRIATNYLDRFDLAAAKIAKEVYRCFEPYHGDEKGYAWSTVLLADNCEREVVSLLVHMHHLEDFRFAGDEQESDEDRFSVAQNAHVMVDAEKYYRTMLRGGPESWNLRDTHMADTFMRIMEFYGRSQEARGIIWAHNSHVGDARATDMIDQGEVSLGQLLRERMGEEDVFLVGMGTYRGGVIASDRWEGAISVINLPEAIPNSLEDVLHNKFGRDMLILNSQLRGSLGYLDGFVGHRAVGVVYDPDAEFGNYVPTKFKDRYDAFFYIDSTKPIRPIRVKRGRDVEPPETYPSSE